MGKEKFSAWWKFGDGGGMERLVQLDNSFSLLLDKICPFINDKCIGDKCMYFFEYYSVKSGHTGLGCNLFYHIMKEQK